MKRLLISLTVACALSGCNSDKIGIHQVANSSTTPANPTPGSVVKESHSQLTSGSQTIYFNQIRLQDGSDPLINGVGFLASNSETQEAFVFGLSTRLPLGSQFMIPNSKGITLLNSAGALSELDLIDITTLNRQKISAIQNARSFSSDASGNVTAWVNTDGEAFIQDKSKHFSKINLGAQNKNNSKATIVASGGPFLKFFSTGGPAFQTLAINSLTGSIENTFQANQAVASPQGTKTLLLRSGQAAQIYDWTKNQFIPLSLKDEVNEPTWKNETQFTYWTESGNGFALKTYDLPSQIAQTVSPLNLKTKMAGIVCPTWVGNTLFFGDEEELSFGIERADADLQSEGSWKTSAFATSTESRYGFACPQSLGKGAAK